MRHKLEIKVGDSPYQAEVFVNGQDILELIPISSVVVHIDANHFVDLALRIPIDEVSIKSKQINPVKLLAGDIKVSREALQAFINQLQEKLDDTTRSV